MNTKSIIFFSAVCFSSILVSAQTPLKIEKTASDVILAVASKNSSPLNEVGVIYPLYYADDGIIEFEKAYGTSYVSYDSLKKYILGLKGEFNDLTNDSALVLLNQYYLRICSTFYNYFKNRFIASNRTKVVFFSASVSCACTLDMCKNQLVDILKIKKDSGDRFDWLVIDSYLNNDLQIKYDAYFAPSVLILNRDNQLINKIEYDEDMIQQLTDFLTAYY